MIARTIWCALKSFPSWLAEVVYKTIFTAINRQGVVFLWPIRLPTPDDRKTDWRQLGA